MKLLKKIIIFIIPNRIDYTVWFAPFAIGIGIYGFIQGYANIGIGAILGGILLVSSYFLKRKILKKG